jgi:tripartite-type tricarboxylate transporter receptor subunit TctC
MHRRTLLAAPLLGAPLLGAPLLGAPLLLAMPARAQDWRPDRPMRLVVPFAPGGAQDVIGRLFAKVVGDAFGQPIVVENRAGAGGLLGGEAVARAAPDGLTLLLATAGQLTIAKALGRRMTYAIEDFAPVTHVLDSPLVLVTGPKLDVANVPALVAAARAARDPFNYASTGLGTNTHLLGAEFAQRLGIEMVHVPYRGAQPAFNDLLSGAVQFMFVSAPSALSFSGGPLRILAVTTRARFPALPDTPTFIEAGVPGFEASIWTGISAPARTPAPVVASLNAAFNAALDDAEMKQRIAVLGATPAGTTPQAFAALLQADLARWSEVARRGGISLE